VKNVQIIDGADNCTFSIFQATDEEFGWLFPEPGQDIQFAEDIVVPAGHTLAELWDRPIRKADVVGIHGTVFYEFEKKRRYFPVSSASAIGMSAPLTRRSGICTLQSRNRDRSHD
jgi:hypothetical protein